jgi:hypothetical protein
VGGEDMLVHLEFQIYGDPGMAERLLRYNILARSEHKLPVLSCVIYLLDDGEVLSPPLIWMATWYICTKNQSFSENGCTK